jgi:2-keto-4-pentenoate hydratase/2-oxohepta-3-ene-1,7-dioic acid hydratase in catechol pathway
LKLASFEKNGEERFGFVRNGAIADLTGRLPSGAVTLAEAIHSDGLDAIRSAADGTDAGLALDDVRLLPPIPRPGKIICIGLNYKTHIAESGHPVPAKPMLFARFANSLVGHGEPLVRPKLSYSFDFEGELAFVLGKSGRHVERKDALAHVAGYACFNDGSIRDYQLHTSQFLPGKTFWRSGSFGPFLVTVDEIPDPAGLSLTTRLNGAVMQHARLDDLLFDIPALIEYVSSITVLDPGDVIVTGTTSGVGFARTPPVWMRPGDKVEVEIAGVGTLVNDIIEEEA